MFQTLIIAGNVGKDAEMRYTPSGKPVTSFSVATNHQYTNNAGEVVKETAWFRVTTWGKLAEICNQYVKKGSKILVEGRLSCDPSTGGPKTWTSQDGSVHASFEVNADAVRFLDSKKDGGQHEEHTEATQQGAPAGNLDDQDIPF